MAPTNLFDTTAPSVPTNCLIAAFGVGEVTLGWSRASDTGGAGLAGYQVYVNGALVATTATTNYVMRDLVHNKEYCVTVLAYDHSGNTSLASGPLCFVPNKLSRIVAWGGNPYNVKNGMTSVSNAVAISAARGYALVLLDAGSVLGFGRLAILAAAPSSLTNVTVAQAIRGHGGAITEAGKVIDWSEDPGSQTEVPTGLSNVVMIAGSSHHGLALKADGTVVAWGTNTYDLNTVPAGATNVVAIAAGQEFSLALKGDGTVIGWGNNSSGQTNVPRDLTNAIAISAGWDHSMALRSDGTVTGCPTWTKFEPRRTECSG